MGRSFTAFGVVAVLLVGCADSSIDAERNEAAERELRGLADGDDVLTGFVTAGAGRFRILGEPTAPTLGTYNATWCGEDSEEVLQVAAEVATLKSASTVSRAEWVVSDLTETTLTVSGSVPVAYGGGGSDESVAFAKMVLRLVGVVRDSQSCTEWTLTGELE